VDIKQNMQRIKTRVLILFLLLCSGYIQSQTAVIHNSQNNLIPATLLNYGNNWSMAEYNACDIMLGNPYWTSFVYTIGSDSILGASVYKKLTEQKNLTDLTKKVIALVRESIGKIYVLQPDKSERLLYDFNLTVGDSIYYQLSQTYNVVSKVTKIRDTSLFGITRKLFEINNYTLPSDEHLPSTEKWIEGIGSMGDFLRIPYFAITGTCSYRTLLCFHSQSTQYYQWSKFNTCAITQVNSVVTVYDDEFQIYSDCNGKLVANFKTILANVNIKLVTLQGTVVAELNERNVQTTYIPVSRFNEGVYVVQVISGKQHYRRKVWLCVRKN